jgi:hypothetical protein
MRPASGSILRAVLFSIGILAGGQAYAQHEQQIRPPEDTPYSRKFFVQLRGVFGRFRDADLQRAFEKAQPIQCSELINDPGEWRTVAFFNEKRELGDWYRSSLEEVKSDLSAFIFKGTCVGEHGPVQLTTKFPVTETVDAYNQGRIPVDGIEVNVNAPVRASFDSQTHAYTFDLPYLFLIRRQEDGNIYSLAPTVVAERDKYATDVVDHWECKSVTAENVTYQFLLCRTTTLPRNRRGPNLPPAFGASAYFILSDGKEASASVKLSVSDANDVAHGVEDLSRNVAGSPAPPAAWEAPDSDERILDIARDEFRIRFNPQSWTSRLGVSQMLYARQLATLASATPASGQDSCVWLPVGGADGLLAAEGVLYAVSARDQEGLSSTSITFDLSTSDGTRFGKLQCFFPRASSAASVTVSRWTSVVGPHLTLEVRP